MNKKGAKAGRKGYDGDHSDEDGVGGDKQLDSQKAEEAVIKQIFQFYQQNRGDVQIERFELPMLMDSCGYKVKEDFMEQINEFLD